MTRNLKILMLSILFGLICATPGSAEDDLRAAAKLVKEGTQHLQDEKYAEALAAFDRARMKQPESAEVAYDRGIALYRLGRLEEAETAFQDALRSDRTGLEASAKFNLGRCAHAAATADLNDLERSINDLSRAIGFYDDALQLRPEDQDAKHNIDRAKRLQEYLKKRLEFQKEQQEQQPSSQPSENDDESQQEGDEQQQSENEQEGEQSDSQQESENQQDRESESEEEPTSQPSPSSQPNEGDEEKEEQEEDQQATSQPEAEKPPQPESQPSTGEQTTQPEMQPLSQPTSQPENKEDMMMRITREQALRMLQEARDAERERREEQRRAKLRRSGRIPVDKDW